MSSQQTHVEDGWINSNEAEIDLNVEAYEGETVAIHVRNAGSDEMTDPACSMYLSPVDAVIHAERIIAAARSLDPKASS